MVAELAGSSHLAQEGSCRGMMGNKDIIKCKLPHRQHWSTKKRLRKRKRKRLHLSPPYIRLISEYLYGLPAVFFFMLLFISHRLFSLKRYCVCHFDHPTGKGNFSHSKSGALASLATRRQASDRMRGDQGEKEAQSS